MTDLVNNYPTWGQTGEAPPDGFFYEGGDQVNEKNFDFLWNEAHESTDDFITGVTTRVTDLSGDVILDSGLVVSDAGGRTVDISASTAGAYVAGQKTGTVSADSITLADNSGGGSTRTDTIYVTEAGSILAATGTTTAPAGTMKIAEVDVSTGNDITGLRNYGRDNMFVVASENAPANPATTAGLWYDKTAGELKVRDAGSWQSLLQADGSVTMTGNFDLGGGDVLNGGAATFASDISADGSTVLTADGSVTMTGSLNLGGNDILNGGTATFASDISADGSTVLTADGTVSLTGNLNIGNNNINSINSISGTGHSINLAGSDLSFSTSGQFRFNTNDVRLGNDLLATGGEVIWDESAGHVPASSVDPAAGINEGQKALIYFGL